MRYLGGKTRIAKQLAAEIDKVRRPGQWVWDAFCGGLSMTKALSVHGPVYSTDACVPLIALYRAVQAGWDPPSEVDEAAYRAARDLPDTDPMKAFCGFGCSFGGKWFGGYARGENRNWASECKRGLLRDARCAGLEFACADWLTSQPRALDGVLYLDPPYAGTTGYAGAPPFDHAAFYRRVAEWSAYGPVFVSEYEMPFGVEVWNAPKRKTVDGRGGGVACGQVATERLYYIAKGSL